VIKIGRILGWRLASEPYAWAPIDGLFATEDAAALAASFPRDNFKTIAGADGEKSYEYVARSLVHMGAQVPSHVDQLSDCWRRLAAALLSPEYRAAMSWLTQLDLAEAPIEVNVVHYGPGAWLGPHRDLPEKIVTHVLYFNRRWDRSDGGCLRILSSADPSDDVAEIAPLVGNSVVLVRSDSSWHCVTRVAEGCRRSRRSINIIFHRPGSVSSMWPPEDTSSLHPFHATD
jgi:Rps23 Pro-64 3,4-dihydroxylase Tpa1-like proline 4-hydroxylase